MNILITGAAGGIGSTLGYHLRKNGHSLSLVDNLNNGYEKNLVINGEKFGDFYKVDIRDDLKLTNIIKSNKIDRVIHLAAISSLPDCEKNSAECMSVNVAGTASVLESCRKANVKQCVFASTGAVYEGNTVDQAPFHEDLPISTKLWYPTSKWMAEQICQRYRSNYGMNIPVLRFFNVFGPRQDIHRPHPPLINYLVRELCAERGPILHGDGSQSRDYVHVDDVVQLIDLVLQSNDTNTEFNVCTGQMMSVKQILSGVQTALNIYTPAQWRESNRLWDAYGDIFNGRFPLNKDIIAAETNKFAFGSHSRATRLLGWTPNTDITAMLHKTVLDIVADAK
jgi:nucleoside-diphosphate-sugar epimerase